MAKDKPLPQAGPELAEYTTAAQPKAYAGGVPVFCAHDAIVPLKDLRPNPKNPNQHPPEQIKLLAEVFADIDTGEIPFMLSGYTEEDYGNIVTALSEALHTEEPKGDPDAEIPPPAEPCLLYTSDAATIYSV